MNKSIATEEIAKEGKGKYLGGYLEAQRVARSVERFIMMPRWRR